MIFSQSSFTSTHKISYVHFIRNALKTEKCEEIRKIRIQFIEFVVSETMLRNQQVYKSVKSYYLTVFRASGDARWESLKNIMAIAKWYAFALTAVYMLRKKSDTFLLSKCNFFCRKNEITSHTSKCEEWIDHQANVKKTTDKIKK